MSRTTLIKLIHVARRELQLDDDTYRAFLVQCTGKTSCRELSVAQLERVLDAMKERGFKKQKKHPRRRFKGHVTPREKIYKIWQQMFQDGFVADGSDAALDKYVARLTARRNGGQPASMVGGRQYITEDPEINRYRPRILVNEDSLTVGGASIRGEWYKARMLGESRTTEITVAGWREQGDSGPLWQTNRLVDIDDSIQNLKTTWLISGVTWTDGAQGRMTVLALVPPESLDMPEMKAKTKKTKAVATWD